MLAASAIACCGAEQWVVGAGGPFIPPVSLGEVDQLAIGQDDSWWAVARRVNGTVAVWGEATSGQAAIPAGLSGVTQIAAGLGHVLALRSDGRVVAWGVNAMRQTSIPAGLTGVVAVAAGSQHSLALKSDGTVVAWGYNLYGQCYVPAGLTGVVKIAAGGNQSIALRSNGSIAAWGAHSYNAHQDISPPPFGPAVDIAAGQSHALALLADGQVVAWSAVAQPLAVVPAGLSNVVALAAQSSVSAALLADGRVIRWYPGGTSDEPVLPGPARAFALGWNGWLAALDSPVYRRPRATVPQDFDGDGRTDLALVQPAGATWYISRSLDGQPFGGGPIVWGPMNGTAVPADYDGDGRADLAAYDSGTGGWYIRRSSDMTAFAGGPVFRGGPGYLPVPQDYDGDGRADLAVYHRGHGLWYVWKSSDNTLLDGAPFALPVYGNSLPVLGDFDGDGRADPAVTSASGFYCLLSRTGTFDAWPGSSSWGGEAPVSADLNGDGVTDRVYWRWKSVLAAQGTVLRAGLWSCWPASYLAVTRLGAAGSMPAVGDYDGDGRSDQAVFAPQTRRWQIFASASRQVIGGSAGLRWPGTRVAGLIPADTQYQINRLGGAQP